MDQVQIDRRVEELRAKYPHSFMRPGIRDGEIFLCASVATFQLVIFRAAGYTSVREVPSPEGVTVDATFYDAKGTPHVEAIDCKDYFVSVREFVEVEAAKEEAAKSAKRQRLLAILPGWLVRKF